MSEKSKKRALELRAQVRKTFAKSGIVELPRDHPIYSGPSRIIFVTWLPKPIKPEAEDK